MEEDEGSRFESAWICTAPPLRRRQFNFIRCLHCWDREGNPEGRKAAVPSLQGNVRAERLQCLHYRGTLGQKGYSAFTTGEREGRKAAVPSLQGNLRPEREGRKAAVPSVQGNVRAERLQCLHYKEP